MLQKEERRNRKKEGTPGYPTQTLGLGTVSQDQIEWERFNLRRVDETDPLRQSDRQAAEAAWQRAAFQIPAPAMRTREAKPWDRLSRTLRAADHVLQSGGFVSWCVVVCARALADRSCPLAETGALNPLGENVHRRDALWQIERAARQAGPLLSGLDRDEEEPSPLQPMGAEERIVADYAGTGVTVGRHPMAHCCFQLRQKSVLRATDLKLLRHGVNARIAGQVIARQRPGTAHGFIFLSLEDETGIANAVIDPDLYEANRNLITYAKFLFIESTLQNVDKVIHVRARHVEELSVTTAPMESHDLH